MTTRFCWFCAAAMMVLGACRKNDGVSSPSDTLMDQILAETRDNYLWFDQIPQNFNARAYSNPADIMQATRAYSFEPGFPEAVDHFSFAIKKSEWDNISSGVAADFGLEVFFMNDNDLRVRAVEKASTAGMAGIKRGWRIINVAGSTDINVSNANFLSDKVYNSSSTAFEFQLPDGSTKNLTLTATTYQEQPVILDTIYSEGIRKAGYLVLHSFLGKINDVTSKLTNVFSSFAANGVTDVIVDLRYNGGGYVSLQQTLANFLVNNAANGKLMMKEEFNAKHSADNQTLLFEKLGSLNINNIYFITGNNTASASELLINNLRPYMNVKLVGEATYGKPVGFFDIQVGDWLIFPVSFRSTNSLGEGNYFNGIAVDREAADGLDKNWGDRHENCLAAALQHITTGSFGYVPQGPVLNSTLTSDISEFNRRLNKGFRGALAR